MGNNGINRGWQIAGLIYSKAQQGTGSRRASDMKMGRSAHDDG